MCGLADFRKLAGESLYQNQITMAPMMIFTLIFNQKPIHINLSHLWGLIYQLLAEIKYTG